MKFSLKEEETGKYREFVSRFLDELAQCGQKLSASLAEVLQRTKYEKLQNEVRKIVEAYNSRITGSAAGNVWELWKESGVALRDYLAPYQVGEEAERVCEAVEGQIEELLRAQPTLTVPEVGTSERPVISNADFDELKKIWADYKTDVEDAGSTFRAERVSLAEENEIYNSLGSLMEYLCGFLESISGTAATVLENLQGEVNQISHDIRKSTEEWSAFGSQEDGTDVGYAKETESAGQALMEGTGGTTIQSEQDGTAGQPGKLEQSGTVGQMEQSEQSEQSGRTEQAEQPELGETGGQPEQAGQPEQSGQPERMEQPADAAASMETPEASTTFEMEAEEEREKPERIKSTIVERAAEAAGTIPRSGKEKALNGIKKAAGVAGAAAAGIAAGGAGLLIGAVAGGIAGAVFGAGLASVGAKKGGSDNRPDASQNREKGEKEENGKERDGKASEKAGKESAGKKDDPGEKRGAGEGASSGDASADAGGDLTREEYLEKYREQIIQVLIEIIKPVGVDRLNQLVEQHQKLISDSLDIHAIPENGEKSRNEKAKSESQTPDSQKEDKKYPYGRYTVNDESRKWMGNEAYETQRLMKPMEEFYKKRYRSVEDTKGYQTAKTVCGTLSTVLVKYFLSSYNFEKSIQENCAFMLLQKITGEGVPEIKDWQKDAVPKIQEGMKKLMPVIEENKVLTRLKKTVLNTVNRYTVRSPLEGYLEEFVLETYERKLNSGFQGSGRYSYYHMGLGRIKDESDREAVEYALFAADIVLSWSDVYHCKIDASEHRKLREAGTGIFLNLLRSGLADSGGMKADTANQYTDYFYEIYQKKEHITPRTELNPMEKEIR